MCVEKFWMWCDVMWWKIESWEKVWCGLNRILIIYGRRVSSIEEQRGTCHWPSSSDKSEVQSTLLLKLDQWLKKAELLMYRKGTAEHLWSHRATVCTARTRTLFVKAQTSKFGLWACHITIMGRELTWHHNSTAHTEISVFATVAINWWPSCGDWRGQYTLAPSQLKLFFIYLFDLYTWSKFHETFYNM